MARNVPIGVRSEAQEVVEFKHTLASHHPELPPVYSTPDMIRLMETAAFQALQPYCEGDEISVGTSINIEHRAASGVGANIKAWAELESFDGRFYTLRVSAWDDVQEIGRGTSGACDREYREASREDEDEVNKFRSQNAEVGS